MERDEKERRPLRSILKKRPTCSSEAAGDEVEVPRREAGANQGILQGSICSGS